ncbi:hypothetical protein SAMN05216559_1714 [Halomicrobium zhouii]|uniref:Uncharacterized protein n=1 Tax=Halomicrobium zhouii TaxID=767519 RepID=A0A1I6L003_9EURY|nr:hypothetical protein [Halomicrobium zhouii]SFR96813.1 hypothetical protein SAMN05216559_1714 [Halomicrobium zhouii]
MSSGRSLRRLARIAGGAAGLSGSYGFLRLMGAFGPVSCWTSQTSSESSSGGVTSTAVSRGCEAGVDYLLGSTGGNAPVLFFWAVVLLALTGVGVVSVWTDRRLLNWATVCLGGVITVVGMFSIGGQFLFPTLCLFAAAVALSVRARREPSVRA